MNQIPPPGQPPQQRRRAPVGRTQVLADMTPPDDGNRQAFLMSCGALIVLVFIASVGCMALNVVGGFIGKPTIAAVGAICAVLLGIPYLLVILWLDRNEKEPPWLLATAFLWGAVISTMVSCVFNTSFGCIAQSALGPIGDLLTSSISAPFIEEITKGLALVAIFLFFKKEFDNVLDGIVYGAIVGLGFAVFENWLYYVQVCNSVEEVFYLAFIRGVVAGVGSHACYTALFGIGIGLFRVMRSGGLRWLMPPLFLGLAMFVHFAWNTFAGLFFAFEIDDIDSKILKTRLAQQGWEVQGKIKRYNAKKIAKGTYYKAKVRADKALPGDPQLKGTVYVYKMKKASSGKKVLKAYPDATTQRDGRFVVVADLPDSEPG
ncbi:MAG: PrsW family intramembrane metalloprotease, partial [Myxococcota bacterium]